MTDGSGAPKDGCTVDEFDTVLQIGDRIGFKIDMSLNKIWLYFNGKLVALLFQNIPDFIIPAISNDFPIKLTKGKYEIKHANF